MVASHPGFLPQVLSHSFGEESAGKHGRISHTSWDGLYLDQESKQTSGDMNRSYEIQENLKGGQIRSPILD